MATTFQRKDRYSFQQFVTAVRARVRPNLWLMVWHGVFYVVLGMTIISSYVQNPDRGAPILVLSGLLAFWYTLSTKIREETWGHHPFLTILYFGIEWVIWLKLTDFSPTFYLVLWGLYPQLSICLDVKFSVVGNVCLVLCVVSYNALAGHPFDFDNGAYNFLGAGLSIIFKLFIETILRESHERKLLIEKLEATRHELAAAERQAGILSERQRLGRDIHDTLAQGFTSIVIQLETAESLLPSEYVDVHHHLDQARQTARDSLAEARRLVWALRPASLAGASLSEALVRVTERWSQQSGILAQAEVNGTSRSLLPEIEVTLLRVAQEALANVRKYAHASQVRLTLSYMDDAVSLDVLDNGIGFNTETVESRTAGVTDGGFGLRGMRERAAELGGTLLIESSPGEGTTVAVSVPALAPPALISALAVEEANL